MKKPELEIGLIVYVETVNNFIYNEPSDPLSYEVTKINTASIYAKRLGGSGREYRFDKKTWVHRPGNGYSSYIWLSKEAYWDKIEEAKKNNELRDNAVNYINSLPIDKLKELVEKNFNM